MTLAAKEWDRENSEMPITQKIIDKIKNSSRRPSEMKDKTIEDYYKKLIEDEVTSFYKNHKNT